MRLTWLRAGAPPADDPSDDVPTLLQALGPDHQLEVFTPETLATVAAAHAHAPFNLAICEFSDAGAGASLVTLPLSLDRVLFLRCLELPNLATLIQSSRMVVVPWTGAADDLRARFPGTDVRVAATGVSPVEAVTGHENDRRSPSQPLVVRVFPPSRIDVVERALAREGVTSAAVVAAGRCSKETLLSADIVVSVPWPWAGQPATHALDGMAAAKPVVVLETIGTAEWPALDPQSWRPRGPGSEPIVVSIDPLDEDHSLGLALARLTKDAPLRAQLGAAARSWWQAHATPSHAAVDWNRILRDAYSFASQA